eukprot:CAMPEP_0194046288 /NCGR_PEP_ID=MMETSP0009_2-20130614/20229_1 /TAXON_ID=210454 /ORGANISM="Grammatophora oceanica, Strain CCMP 410" /LENGTH=279 /DNA_ID=CAMNT_0038691507 /DNA_START=35 /DNA_END=874 /DNA_ORIENTATION=+
MTTEVVVTAAPAPAPPAVDYWAESANEELKGARLSELSLSGLGKSSTTTPATEDEASSPKKKEEEEETKKTPGGGYWDWTEPIIGKTLSALNLSSSKPKVREVTEAQKKNYWHWRNSFRDAKELEEKESSNKEKEESTSEQPAAASYWFWRSASNKSLTDEVDGDNSTSEKPKQAVGPISMLDHKMRTSWRKSMQKLSSNSLGKLDEEGKPTDTTGTTANSSTTWRDSFRSFRNSFHTLNGGTNNNNNVEEDASEQQAAVAVQATEVEDTVQDDGGITF